MPRKRDLYLPNQMMRCRLICCIVGLRGALRGCSTISSSEQRISALKEKVSRLEDDSSVPDDEIEKIRWEFNAAKRSFLNIPDALKEMPKMNPQGLNMKAIGFFSFLFLFDLIVCFESFFLMAVVNYNRYLCE